MKDAVEIGDTTEGEEESGRPRVTLQEMLDDLTLSEMDHDEDIDVDDDE